MADRNSTKGTLKDRIEDLALRTLLSAIRIFPWSARGKALGWVTRRMIGPLAGWTRRADANLRLVWPDMVAADRRIIVDAAMDNIGRSFAEIYDPAGLRACVKGTTLEGDGVEHMLAALADGRPVVLISGHYGNYEAPKAALAERGYPVSMIYRPGTNPFFNDHYWKTLQQLGGTPFEQGGEGTAAFLAQAKAGQLSALLFDVYIRKGVDLPFLGHPARTALSAARLALETGALLIPFWGIRKSDGASFRLIFEAPIAHTDEVQMMTAATERLEARIAEDPGQWLWSHRRWKD